MTANDDPMITLGVLDDTAIRHAFFTRRGGVSEGVFGSLNCGFGSADDPEKVGRNRAIAADRLGLGGDRLVTCYQVHGASVVTVETPWRREDSPHADGMVTTRPGIALGVLAADCAPVLFADAAAGVIGAAHGGWRGALTGVMEATVARMTALGADPARIRAGIGPCIAQASYEVGPEFPSRFAEIDADSGAFFVPALREGHFRFDLPGYIGHRLARLGLGAVERAPHDTVTEPDRFFSYRRACLVGEHDYGRGLAAIALSG
ncbi:MAG TPA: peptidoglycan editing factor PgeF [Stellaceae bacterium]|nr:peptidoglycan editing factor PgeF [Stellaceae bacterium]